MRTIFKNPDTAWQACVPMPSRNWQDQVQIETGTKGRRIIESREERQVQLTAMVRSLLLLVLVASVFSSTTATAQVGGSIRGSSTATESSSAASSALASAASTFLKVWPHPAAQVLHHATNAVRRKLVSYTSTWISL